MNWVSAFLVAIIASTFVHAEDLKVIGSAPEGAIVVVRAKYSSTSESWSCTEFSFDQFKRIPKVIEQTFIMMGENDDFTIRVPEILPECESELGESPKLEVMLKGTRLPSKVGLPQLAIEILESANNVKEVQSLFCAVQLTYRGTTTKCSKSEIFVGPSGRMNIKIETVD